MWMLSMKWWHIFSASRRSHQYPAGERPKEEGRELGKGASWEDLAAHQATGGRTTPLRYNVHDATLHNIGQRADAGTVRRTARSHQKLKKWKGRIAKRCFVNCASTQLGIYTRSLSILLYCHYYYDYYELLLFPTAVTYVKLGKMAYMKQIFCVRFII